MKKFLLTVLSLAFLFTGNAWGEDDPITLTNGVGSGSGTSYSITWSGTSCDITQTKGSSSTSVSSSYISAPRWYQNHKISFKAKSGYTLSEVVVECTTNAYAEALGKSTYTSGASASYSSAIVTITTSGDFDITMGAQSRISSIKVTYTSGEGGDKNVVTMSADAKADIKFVTGSSAAASAVWANSTPLSAKGITLSGEVTSGTNYSYYDGSVVRFYTNNNLVITPAAGVTIVKIEIVRSTSTSSNSGTISCSGLTAAEGNTTTNTNVYTGSTTSAVTISNSAQARFSKINVYIGDAPDPEKPTVTSIAVSGTPAALWKGDEFSHEGVTVTAKYSDAEDEDVTAKATFSGYDMTTAGQQVVTVEYGEQTATYTVNVQTIANTQETAYTVAQAIAKIDAGKDLATEVYVKGKVSSIPTAWSSQYNNATYNISDDGKTTSAQFQLFRCVTNHIAVGGDVVAKGTLTKHSSTYEFAAGNSIVAYTDPETPVVVPEYSSLAALIEGEGAPTEGGAAVKVSFTNDVITRITDDRKGIFFLVGEREVEVYCATTCPVDWTVNGQVSGTLVEGSWKDYKGTWEVVVADWTAFEYTAYVSHVTGVTFANSSVFVGKTLDLASLVEIAPADASNKNVSFEVVSGSENITIAEGVATGVAAGPAVVRVNTEDGGFTAEATIAVVAVPVWATTYTSNVELSTTGGTSATASKVKVNGEETEYDAIKAGTSKADGSIKVTLPMGTTKLHFHAVTWDGSATTATLSVKKDGNDTELFGNVIRPNTGFSSNSPYTLAGDPTDDYYSIDFGSALTEATTLVFDASVNRFGIYGVNVEKVNVELLSIAVSGTATNKEYEVGDVFDPAGLVVTGTYNIGEPQEITEGIEWSFDPATLAAGTTSVSVVATVGEKSSEAFVVNGLNVVVAPLHATWVASEQGYANETEVTSTVLVANAVNATFDNGSKYYTTGAAIRVYGGKSFTISAVTGFTISKIVLTYGTGDVTTNAISADCGTFETNTWTGEATSVKFTEAGTTGQRRIASITVYYSGEIAGNIVCGGNAYETLAEAIAAEDGGTISVLADLNENIVIPVGKTFTLDLNGHTLNGAQAANTATIKNLGTLTIQNGTILRSGEGSASYYVIENEGTMTLNCNVEGSASSSLICNNAAEAKMTFVGGEYTQTGAFIVVKNDLGEVIINDGTFTTSAAKNVLNNWDRMTINGGTFNGRILSGAYDIDNTKLTINGGTFNTEAIRSYIDNGQEHGLIEIKGGEFTNASMIYVGKNNTEADANIQVAVSGGKFANPVPADYCAEGFQPLDNGDETYGVQEEIKVTEIVLSGDFRQVFTQKDDFEFDGTVTAKYNRQDPAVVTEQAIFSGYDMSATGPQTVTVSYTENDVTVTTTYDILVKAAAGSMSYETVDFTAIEPYAGLASGSVDITGYSGVSFEIAFSKGTNNNNKPAYYKTGTSVRCYVNNTITITAIDPILAVDINWTEEKGEDTGVKVEGVGTQTVTITISKTCSFDAISVYYKVAKIGEDYYATLAEAFDVAAAATTGSTTITLIHDVTENVSATMGTRNVILDLNGHILTGDLSMTSETLVTTALTIWDKVQNSNGKIVGNVSVHNCKLQTSSSYRVLFEGTITFDNSCDITTFYGTVINSNTDETAIVVRGLDCKVRITNAAIIDANKAIEVEYGTLIINSGSSTRDAKISGYIKADGEDATLIIYGGEFNMEIDPKFIALGYEAVKNGNVWTVEKMTSYTRENLTVGNYGTICLPYASSDFLGMELYSIDHMDETGLYLAAVAGQMEAGMPYIFKATADQINVTYTGEPAEASKHNGLIGSYKKEMIEEDENNYILSGNQLWLVNSEAYVGANRAYIHYGTVDAAPARLNIVVANPIATAVENLMNRNEATKMLKGGKVVILRAGHMYDLNGRLMK